MKDCPIPGCRGYVLEHQCLCHDHWSLTPLPLQKTITRLYANGKIFPGYEEACASAIEQVTHRAKFRQRSAPPAAPREYEVEERVEERRPARAPVVTYRKQRKVGKQ